MGLAHSDHPRGSQAPFYDRLGEFQGGEINLGVLIVLWMALVVKDILAAGQRKLSLAIKKLWSCAEPKEGCGAPAN